MDSAGKWADLPSDILSKILSCLNAQMYHHLLRAVCPSWRSSLPLSGDGGPYHRHLQLQVLEFPLAIKPGKHRDINIPSHDTLSEKIFFLVTPLDQANNHQQCNGIIQVEETESKKWSFFNPLTGVKLSELPPGLLTGPVNLLGYRFTEFGRSFSLRWMDEISKREGFSLNGKVVCSSGSYSMEASSAFMALFANGKLAFWKPGFEQWYPLEGFDKYFDDIIFYKGRFYAVDGKGRVMAIDPSTWWDHVPIVSCVCIDESYGTHGMSLDLIVSEGSLYLTVREITGDSFTTGFPTRTEVYVLKEQGSTRLKKRKRSGKKCKWVRVRNIGDQMFFVGHTAAFSLSSVVLGWNIKNCIYFFNPCLLNVVGIYDLNEDEFVPFNRWVDHRLFWPPPSWIDPNADLHPDMDPYESHREIGGD